MFGLKYRLLVGVCFFGVIGCSSLVEPRVHTKQDVLKKIEDCTVLLSCQATKFDKLQEFVNASYFDQGHLDFMKGWRQVVSENLLSLDKLKRWLGPLSKGDCNVAFRRLHYLSENFKKPTPWLEVLTKKKEDALKDRPSPAKMARLENEK